MQPLHILQVWSRIRGSHWALSFPQVHDTLDKNSSLGTCTVTVVTTSSSEDSGDRDLEKKNRCTGRRIPAPLSMGLEEVKKGEGRTPEDVGKGETGNK